MAKSNSKRRKYKPKDFESTGVSNDTSANIYESMLQSPAWKDLKPRERQLYLYCKSQYYGKRKPSKDYPDIEAFQSAECFYLNLASVVNYGIYKRSGNKEFYSDMKTLAEHGFIEVVSSGRYTKTKSIYKYSSKWKNWKKTEKV
jgi:hypothetical protein